MQAAEPTLSRRRPYWVLAVVAMYALIVGGLLVLPWISGTAPVASVIFTAIWLVLTGLLMYVPLQVRRQRPITRRTIWMPLVVTGFLAGLVAFAAALALYELSEVKMDSLWPLCGAAVGVWAMWAGLFYLATRKVGRMRVAMTLHHWLFAGSMLELLIAVPCHIIVRRRGVCCAGILTGTAIATGVLMLILALGPGVALLYLRRWRQIRLPEDGRGFEVAVDVPVEAGKPGEVP